MKCYYGQIQDEKMLKKTASGGFAYAMYTKVLDKGGVCYGASYTDDFKGASYIRVTDRDKLNKLITSKYVKATLDESIVSSLTEDIKCGKKVIFIGLPCDVYYIIKKINNLKLPTDNLITCDLKCNGPTLPCGFKSYVEHLEEKYNQKVKNIITPYKNPSWYPVCIKVVFEDNSEYIEELAKTDLGVAFDFLKDEKCYYCKYKGDNHKSDMTISNYWGIKITDPGFNYYGTSYAYVYTKKGEDFLKSIPYLNLFDDVSEETNLPLYSTDSYRVKQMNKFKKDFEKYGLLKAVKKRNSFLLRLARILKI